MPEEREHPNDGKCHLQYRRKSRKAIMFLECLEPAVTNFLEAESHFFESDSCQIFIRTSEIFKLLFKMVLLRPGLCNRPLFSFFTIFLYYYLYTWTHYNSQTKKNNKIVVAKMPSSWPWWCIFDVGGIMCLRHAETSYSFCMASTWKLGKLIFINLWSIQIHSIVNVSVNWCGCFIFGAMSDFRT